MTANDVIETIRPILVETYGNGSMVHALAEHLGAQIHNWPDTKPPGYGARTREELILHTCWGWFSGGSTAEAVTEEIEAALNA